MKLIDDCFIKDLEFELIMFLKDTIVRERARR